VWAWCFRSSSRYNLKDGKDALEFFNKKLKQKNWHSNESISWQNGSRCKCSNGVNCTRWTCTRFLHSHCELNDKKQWTEYIFKNEFNNKLLYKSYSLWIFVAVKSPKSNFTHLFLIHLTMFCCCGQKLKEKQRFKKNVWFFVHWR